MLAANEKEKRKSIFAPVFVFQRGRSHFLVGGVSLNRNEPQYNKIVLTTCKGKNNVTTSSTSNPQYLHHASCDTYYNESTKAVVEFGPESGIYMMFGYQGCCKQENGWIPAMEHESLSIGSHLLLEDAKNGIFLAPSTADVECRNPCSTCIIVFPTCLDMDCAWR